MFFLKQAFFQRNVCVVARELLGAELVWGQCSGRIIETEAYAAQGDPACHTATRPSARQFLASHPPGCAYVYLNYGIYWLLNLVVKGGDRDGMVLIRALEPLSGLTQMEKRRSGRPQNDWCSGPGKLGRALGIGAADHGRVLAGPRKALGFGVRRRECAVFWNVLAGPRVGITRAVDFPWRFRVAE
jgi:DNA-3-methyladenine glycosylase